MKIDEIDFFRKSSSTQNRYNKEFFQLKIKEFLINSIFIYNLKKTNFLNTFTIKQFY